MCPGYFDIPNNFNVFVHYILSHKAISYILTCLDIRVEHKKPPHTFVMRFNLYYKGNWNNSEVHVIAQYLQGKLLYVSDFFYTKCIACLKYQGMLTYTLIYVFIYFNWCPARWTFFSYIILNVLHIKYKLVFQFTDKRCKSEKNINNF